jgi:hypothetical protein
MDPVSLLTTAILGAVSLAAVLASVQENRRRQERARSRWAQLAKYDLEVVEGAPVLTWRRRGRIGGLEARTTGSRFAVTLPIEATLLKFTSLEASPGFSWPRNPQTHEVILPSRDAVIVDLGNGLHVGGGPAAAMALFHTPAMQEATRAVMLRRNSVLGQGGVRHGRFSSSPTALTIVFDALDDGDIEADVRGVLERAENFQHALEAAAEGLPVLREPLPVLSTPSVSSGGSSVAVRTFDR